MLIQLHANKQMQLMFHNVPHFKTIFLSTNCYKLKSEYPQLIDRGRKAFSGEEPATNKEAAQPIKVQSWLTFPGSSPCQPTGGKIFR